MVETYSPGRPEIDVLMENFDPRAVAAMANPYGLLNELRDECPVGHSNVYGGFWNLFQYSDVCAAALDVARFSSRDVTIPSEPFSQQIAPIMVDPPVHKDFRGPLLTFFGPQAVARLADPIRAKVTELIDSFAESGHADLVDRLFLPFPAYAAMKLLGLPEKDYPLFARWAKLAFTIPDEGTPDSGWEAEAAAYYGQIYDETGGSEANDLVSVARKIQVGGREIERMEYVGLLITLVNAGLDTTTNAAGNIVLLMDEQPEIRERIARDPAVMARAVEELLRYLTPLPMLARVANMDVPMVTGGETVVIPAGDKVGLNWLAANHDPAEFADPGVVVLDRKPNRHLAFGYGPHRCLGMHLARLEIRIMLEELLSRLPDYVVVSEGVVRGPGVTRAVEELSIRFTPVPRSTA